MRAVRGRRGAVRGSSVIRVLFVSLMLLILGVAVLTMRHHQAVVLEHGGDRGHGRGRLVGVGDFAELDAFEAPVVEAPVVEAPAVEALAVEAPAVREPKPAAAVPETPKKTVVASPSGSDRSRFVHVVFSTDCTSYQDWQSEVVFNSADVVGHLGPVTRIASGCKGGREAELRRRYEALYGRESRFSLHVTPEFNKDAATGKSYHFYNKPRGIEHFLNEGGFDFTAAPIVALIDPDFAFLRPLTDEIGNDASTLVLRPWTRDELPARVARGTPAGQQYGLGAHWLTFDREKICGKGSPCVETSHSDAVKYYPVGPPYMLHVEDWRALAPVWRDFAPRVYEQYPDLLAEMYAYCMAAAHLQLRHARVNHNMLSNVHVQDEGWAHLDALPLGDVCPTARYDTPTVVAKALDGQAAGLRLPGFLHFCQNYRLGEYMFAKRRIPPKLFTACDHPFLEEATLEIKDLDYELHPPGNPCKEQPARKLVPRKVRNRTAAVVCLATWHVNAAAKRARHTFCDGEPPPPDPVRVFTLATTCAKDGRHFHSNG